jgi:pyrroloquinoline quinone biosynthesis protein D
MSAVPQRCLVTGETVLRFPPGVKLRFDGTRQRWTVLAPERLFLPDEQSVEILRLVDGARRVDAILDDLAARFDAPRAVIEGDVVPLLQELADKGVLQG